MVFPSYYSRTPIKRSSSEKWELATFHVNKQTDKQENKQVQGRFSILFAT